MLLGLLGSIAIAPIASDAWLSVIGAQVLPPSMVSHTPPAAVPRYIIRGLVGLIASEVARPDHGGVPGPNPMYDGPSKFHVSPLNESAGATPSAGCAQFETAAFARLPAAFSARCCCNALVRAPAGMCAKGYAR